MQPFSISVDERTIRAERAKARELRDSAWWTNQIGRGRCFYCHESVPPRELTMDHKTPIARGGRSRKSNLVPACKACNNEKKYLTLTEWSAQRMREGRPLACTDSDLS